MILSKTFFVDRQPVGMIREDSDTGQVDFSPLKGKSPLPQRQWGDVDELKLAVIAAYQKKNPPEFTSGSSDSLTKNFSIKPPQETD